MIQLIDKKVVVEQAISSTPAIVWEIITDTQYWSHWGPSVREVDCSDRHIHSGSAGRVRTALGFWLPFTITTCIAMKTWAWRIGPVKATGHTIRRATENSCTLCFDIPRWAVLYLPVCWIALKRIQKLAEAYP